MLIAAPPVDVGAVNATESCPLEAVMAEILGADGGALPPVVVIFSDLTDPEVPHWLALRAWVISMKLPSV